MSKTRRLAATALAAILAAGTAATQAGDRLVYAGDAPSTHGVMRDLAALFEAKTGIQMALRLADSSAAVRATARGETDLGGTARPALDDPRERGVTLFPVAWDALAVVVHPDNPAGSITLQQLAAVLTGELDHWRPLGGPDGAVNVHLPADPLGGINYNLRALLFEDPFAELAVDRPAVDVLALQDAVASDPRALGVTSLATARDAGLRILAVDGVSPSPGSLAAGAYPLFQPLQIAVAGGGGLAERFVRFAQSPPARRILRRNGTLPYPEGLGLAGHALDRAANPRP